ncbi:hypothetical protein D1B33_09740 [Lysinibacillus yapensis]|uniref:Uncharacterized protein n=1 Tax=Ureibacillus yapensis TaxID=2304605 RepID=A0A396SDM1_9BACL|nr:hypothetical protein [Lysinibacillus yapensis]RHW36674.1 hypothetical protein D1B33_09740 [Lysinibacillus yapensis]
MEEKVEKNESNKIIDLRNKVGEKGSEIRNKIGETFEQLNFLKHFTELDKEVSINEKEKALQIIEAIKGIENDDIKADVLKDYFKSNNQKEIIETIIYAMKYVSGASLVAVIVWLLNKNGNK